MEYRVCSVETCRKRYGIAEGVNHSAQLSVWGREMLRESLILEGLPSDTPIERGENGKPFLPFYPTFHFNISHTRSHVALALHSSPIGVDIEPLRVYKEDLVCRFFHPKEATFLESLPNQERNEAFTRLWTLKEAFVKHSGTGIANTFNRFYLLPQNGTSTDWNTLQIESPKTPFPFLRLQSLYIAEEELYLAVAW